MDPRMYNAAMNDDMQDGDFSLDEHLKREEENGYQVTPNGNTILHVATLFGQGGFIREVLMIIPGLLCYKNKKNETALHIAANAGQSEVVSELLSVGGRETLLVRMTDDAGDTALHKAVRGGHLEIVRMLVRLLVDSELDFPANKAGETPLYLAAEFGFHDALIEILNICKEPTYVAGPSKRTPLHAAVIQEHKVFRSHIMDPRMYNAALNGDMQDGDFSLDEHLKREEENGYQVTPNGNTILHVATLFGQGGFIREVRKIIPGLLCYKNKKNETALHIAANAGQSEVVSELLSVGGGETLLVRMTDDAGDTALHKAVRGGHLEIVRMLVRLLVDLELNFPANKVRETPLYLAAESGFHDALIEILNICKETTYVAGPSKRTPLHAAIIQENKECAISLWQWNKYLCEEADEWGWNSLHCAVKQGLRDLVCDMLGMEEILSLPSGRQ